MELYVHLKYAMPYVVVAYICTYVRTYVCIIKYDST